MTWIKTIPLAEASRDLLEAMGKQKKLYPVGHPVDVVEPGSDDALGVGREPAAR